ncbi:MAG: hypothetical protein KDA32_09430 [Phycisphaerales bacterium]|nr:hypothetical protein [Phycisphaerales bacterium]
MARKCVSCGMPLRMAADCPGGDMSKDYCVHCAKPDGAMKSYGEVHRGMSQFLMRTQGIDAEAAERMATKMMAGMPAWAKA